MSKKLGILALVIALAALGLSAYNTVKIHQPTAVETAAEARNVQYAIYLGTNDKDSYEPYGTPDEVKARVDEVLTNHFEGFTIEEANGGWTNEDGTVDHEYTVVILLNDTTSEKVHAASDDLIKAFNQSSVMITETEMETEFYSGN